MTISIVAFLLACISLGVYAFFSLRSDGWRRYVGPIGFSVVLIVAGFGFFRTLGGCLPEWAVSGGKIDIMAIAYDQPNAVYLWGVVDNSPKCIALPWTDEQAGKIREVENEGGPLEYVPGDGPDTPGFLHPKPVEALPPKDNQ